MTAGNTNLSYPRYTYSQSCHIIYSHAHLSFIKLKVRALSSESNPVLVIYWYYILHKIVDNVDILNTNIAIYPPIHLPPCISKYTYLYTYQNSHIATYLQVHISVGISIYSHFHISIYLCMDISAWPWFVPCHVLVARELWYWSSLHFTIFTTMLNAKHDVNQTIPNYCTRHTITPHVSYLFHVVSLRENRN
jgi:hypothetical protein